MHGQEDRAYGRARWDIFGFHRGKKTVALGTRVEPDVHERSQVSLRIRQMPQADAGQVANTGMNALRTTPQRLHDAIQLP